MRRRRIAAIGSLATVIVVAIVITLSAGAGGSKTNGSSRAAGRVTTDGASSTSPTRTATRSTGTSGTARVPILMYHVINVPPAGSPSPGLYVPADQFAAQMRALKAAGWHAVTLNQLRANWTRGVALGPGKPMVLTFDNGYASQYTNALPVLKQLGWVGDENLQLAGLPPSQGGITDAQVKGLLAAGWELDTQGISQADLVSADAAQLHDQITTARQILRSRYGVPVNWFSYPSGHYDAPVIAAVKAAGFVGSTTVVPGWATPQSDPYRLPRLRVLAGTSPSELLAQISASASDGPPPDSYTGA